MNQALNATYEKKYSEIIEPIYGPRGQFFYNDISYLHEYAISKKDRVNMTMHEVYSIDPPLCEDADDAFSIYYENNNLYMAIHIADPTDYIRLNSNMWICIQSLLTTKYPSNRKPIHMMPPSVLEASSLMDNKKGNIKKAISVITEINEEDYSPCGTVELKFTMIKLKKENAYTYEQAGKIIKDKDKREFEIALNIGNFLYNKRSQNNKGAKLSDLSPSHNKYKKNEVTIEKDSEEERQMKKMISEFAIFANSFVGNYLKVHLNTGMFRSCIANDWLENLEDDIGGKDMLQEIITNGIKAEYVSDVKPHDLVGMPEYTHFTSPLRRISDCVCHYLLKYIYYRNYYGTYPIPFTNDYLKLISEKCIKNAKKDRNNQYLDNKFRYLQVMDNMLETKAYINITYFITSYSGLFLNIIIWNINEHDIYMSYVLRVKNYNKKIIYKEKNTIQITHVNCFEKFDNNTIPELDHYLLYCDEL